MAWRFTKEQEDIWKKVITAEYCLYSPWCRQQVTSSQGVTSWKNIRMLLDEFEKLVKLKAREINCGRIDGHPDLYNIL